MRYGICGRYGSPGNKESASCGFYGAFKGSNPILSAKPFIIS
jgi:hypothetical protein